MDGKVIKRVTRYFGWLAILGYLSMPAWAADGGVLVFGGNRETGLEVVRTLLAKGEKVTVMVRPTADAGAAKALGAAIVTGDALDPSTVKAAFASAKFRAVVSTIGGKRGEPRPDYEGVKNIIDAANAAGVKRMVLVTAIGTGDSAKAVSDAVHKVLGAVFIEKGKGEDYLMGSGLTYTIIRPGGLRSGGQTGNGMLTEDRMTGGTIYREDLGKLVADAIDDTKTFNKVFHAVDRDMIDHGQSQPSPELKAARPL